jgi:hypothetical protein
MYRTAYLCSLLAMGSSNLTLSYNISDWGECQESFTIISDGTLVEGEFRSRIITICDDRGLCTTIVDNSEKDGYLFNLHEECKQKHEIVAIVFCSVLFGIIVLGCMWKCGCCLNKVGG